MTQCDAAFLTAPVAPGPSSSAATWDDACPAADGAKAEQNPGSKIRDVLFLAVFNQLGDARDGAREESRAGWGQIFPSTGIPSWVLSTLSPCGFLVVAIPFPIPWV